MGAGCEDSLGLQVVVPYQWQCHLLLETSLATLSCREASGGLRDRPQGVQKKMVSV